MNAQTFEIAQLDEEIRSLKMKLQLKRAQGYALRPEELAHYEYLLAKREEMSNAQHSFNGRNASRTSPQRHSPQRVSPQRVSPQKLPRTNVSLSVADIVSIFRIFDLGKCLLFLQLLFCFCFVVSFLIF
jgi:hypothetical protein